MKNLLIFTTGAALGSVVTWKLIEKYYRDLADEEIESVVETFKNREKESKKLIEEKVEDSKQKTESKKRGEDKVTQAKLVNSLNYGESTINEVEDKLVRDTPENMASILILDPTDYGVEDGFDTKSWMLWNDGILTNEFDEIVDNPELLIGDALSHFGDYETDSVYIRNKAIQADIEILLSEKDFNE